MSTPHRTGVPLKGGDERDAMTGWRKYLNFRPGERKAAKVSYNRRVRREGQRHDVEED